MDSLKIFDTWKSEALKDLGRADRGVSHEDWDQVIYYCQQALEKLVKGIYLILLNKKYLLFMILSL
jgi:HEPN domain-containing protein